jgi:hypothetical protein
MYAHANKQMTLYFVRRQQQQAEPQQHVLAKCMVMENGPLPGKTLIY